MRPDLHITAPEGVDRVLLHTCCAPCSGAIIECLLANGITPTLFYSNDNIYPRAEYEHRRDECSRYAASLGLTVVEDDYDHDRWRGMACALADEPERGARCLECFRHRLVRAARYASEHGFRVLTTTLASSRWKRLDQVNEAGRYACSLYPDVLWWDQNWRKGGLQERRGEIIREMSFYNQQYCGCEYSFRSDAESGD